MSKQVEIVRNFAGGFDLRTERDSGNTVTILTGKRERSLEYWENLLATADLVVATLKAELEDKS